MSTVRASGIALVEVLLAVAIITVIGVAVSYSIISYTTARESLLTDVKTAYLAEEGYELMRALRNDDWSTFESLALDTPLFLSVSTSTIAIAGGSEVIDGTHSRQVILREVWRDSDDDITASTTVGASIDLDLRQVEVTVGGPSGTTTFTGILSNVFAL